MYMLNSDKEEPESWAAGNRRSDRNEGKPEVIEKGTAWEQTQGGRDGTNTTPYYGKEMEQRGQEPARKGGCSDREKRALKQNWQKTQDGQKGDPESIIIQGRVIPRHLTTEGQYEHKQKWNRPNELLLYEVARQKKDQDRIRQLEKMVEKSLRHQTRLMEIEREKEQREQRKRGMGEINIQNKMAGG